MAGVDGRKKFAFAVGLVAGVLRASISAKAGAERPVR